MQNFSVNICVLTKKPKDSVKTEREPTLMNARHGHFWPSFALSNLTSYPLATVFRVCIEHDLSLFMDKNPGPPAQNCAQNDEWPSLVLWPSLG